MEKLPKEAINKIMFCLSHPVAEIFKIELEVAHKAFLARELTSALREQEQLLDSYEYDYQYDEEYEEDRRQRLIRIEQEEEMARYCDCCANLWTECQCMCSHCYGSYSVCPYSCYNDDQGLNIMNH